MEPVRVKVYGLFWRTRQRYIVESILGFGYGFLLLLVWWAFWPDMHQKLTNPEWIADHPLPTYMVVTIAILNQVPLILLVAAAVKVYEMWLVLRRFAAKEAERLAPPTKPSPP